MEDQINAAEKARSISAEICQWSGAIFGVLFGLGFLLTEFKNNDFKSVTWWKPISALVAGATVSAHGSNVINNKRTAALTALLVRSTNSASELPISQTTEYSDLLEDSENKWLSKLVTDLIRYIKKRILKTSLIMTKISE